MNYKMHHHILFLLVSTAILFTGCKKNYEEAMSDSLVKKNFVPVFVEDIQTTSEVIPVFAIGRVSSDTETKLSFKTGGYISTMRAKEGDYVKKGKLLARLGTEEIDAQVLKAERGLQKSKRDLERVTNMYNDSVATIENVQDLTTQVEVIEADLRIATYNQRYSNIVSPLSGRILRRLSEPNELVSPGQPIFIIASSAGQSYIMKVNISDKDIPLISYGTKANLTFDAFKGQVFTATVNRIAESADPATGTFEIELSIDTNKSRLRNGMIGKVSFQPSSKNSYVKIPMMSIAEGDQDLVKIFIPDETDTIAVEKQLRVVRFGDKHVWVNQEEMPEKRIITAGSAYLKDGQVIRILESKIAQ